MSGGVRSHAHNRPSHIFRRTWGARRAPEHSEAGAGHIFVAVVIVCTPLSRCVYFMYTEIGAFWSRMTREGPSGVCSGIAPVLRPVGGVRSFLTSPCHLVPAGSLTLEAWGKRRYRFRDHPARTAVTPRTQELAHRRAAAILQFRRLDRGAQLDRSSNRLTPCDRRLDQTSVTIQPLDRSPARLTHCDR